LKEIVSHIPDASGRDHVGYRRFLNRYCGGGQGATNLKELNYRLNLTCFYRREKTEVLKDLPAKLRQVVLCEISNRREYEHAKNSFVEYLKNVRGCSDAEVRKKLRGEVMVQMGILKQISARGKMEAVRDHIDEITESGEKVIVFCSLREIGNNLKEIYPDAVMIRGGMSPEEKDLSVRRFQQDPNVNVIICSIKAAGVGLTLTASSRVVFVEFPWTFADCEQCEDRAHRIGQTDSVQCAYFLGEDTIDRYCYELIQKKKTIAQDVTGATDDVDEEIIDELLNLFNQK
jgi:SWI/SNF-related matrix-associated actin-dependent regulator of chromatin subfamily A-like protein 1